MCRCVCVLGGRERGRRGEGEKEEEIFGFYLSIYLFQIFVFKSIDLTSFPLFLSSWSMGSLLCLVLSGYLRSDSAADIFPALQFDICCVFHAICRLLLLSLLLSTILTLLLSLFAGVRILHLFVCPLLVAVYGWNGGRDLRTPSEAVQEAK